MADKNLDSDQDTGVQGSPNPDASQGSDVQQGSGFDAAKLQTDIDTLTKSVAGLSKAVSTMQSGKDRAVKEVKSDIKSLFGEYETLKERLGPEGAIEQIELKQQLSAIQEQLSNIGSSSTAPVGNSEGGATDVAKAISRVQEYGLDANAPDFLEVLKQNPTMDTVNNYILDRVKAQREPSLGGVSTEPAKGSKPKPKIEEVTNEYMDKYKAAVEKRDPNLARDIKNEYREKGVPVDNISWEVRI